VDQEVVSRRLADDLEVVHQVNDTGNPATSALKLDLVTPAPWYFSPVTDPMPLIPCG
jgi:hypothetical protein